MTTTVSQAVAKAAGKVAGIEAHIKGLRGVFKTLAEQHREASSLLSKMQASDDPDQRAVLWLDVRRALLAHERAELAEVYPEIAASPTTEQLAQRHSASAGELETAISELDAIPTGHSRWKPAFERLVGLVTTHVNEEESDYFPRAQEVLGEQRVDALRQAYIIAHEQELERLDV